MQNQSMALHCGILDLGEEEGWHERALLSQIFVALIAELATKSCRHTAMPRAHCMLVYVAFRGIAFLRL